MKRLLLLLFISFFSITLGERVLAAKQIQIVGSSTALPFTSLMAERFGKDTNYKTPIIEANGTGGGIYQFCSGVGLRYPDIVASSRPMTFLEKKRCAQNGVNEKIEMKIGYDGIIIGQSTQSSPLSLTSIELRKALAAFIWNPNIKAFQKNTFQNWHEINPHLPSMPIRIIGPAPHTGTREILEEKLMLKACANPHAKNKCKKIRDDGRYIDANANENLIINKLLQSPQTIGIFGYSFYEENQHHIRAIPLNGIMPSYRSIQTQSYPLARGLYLYVKKVHLNYVPGLRKFISYIIRDKIIHEKGILREKSFIALPEKELRELQKEIKKQIEINN